MLDPTLLLTQLVNGVQFGFMLFLIAAGLTLVFGIMNFANLAHGAFFMVGAYLAASSFVWSGSFVLAACVAVLGTGLLGFVLEILVFRHFYHKDHLTHFLLTFGLILIFSEGVRMIWGPFALSMPLPDALDDVVELPGEIVVPAYRLLIIGVGGAVAVLLALLIQRTRFGMLIRAGAQDYEMVTALGVDMRRLHWLVLALGSALAGLAGALVAPLSSVESGMGDRILILTLVVVVIGGLGSVRGAFVAALLTGILDTVGRTVLPSLLRTVVDPAFAAAAGPGLASIFVYIVMAVVLFARPEGLLPVGGR